MTKKNARKIEFHEVTMNDVHPLAQALLRMFDPEVTKHFNMFREGMTLEREIEYLTRMVQSEHDRIFEFHMNLKNERSFELIGTAGLHEIDEYLGTARLGIIIWRSQYHHQGIGTQAIIELIRLALREHPKLHKVYVMIRADNPHETTLYERIGFVREGVLRQEYPFGDQRIDMIRMSMLRKECENAQATQEAVKFLLTELPFFYIGRVR